MVRRPNQFLIKEKLKELQNFLIEASIETKNSNFDEEVVDMKETDPLLDNNSCQKVTKMSSIFQSFFRKSQVFETGPNPLESEYNWWTKFYNSQPVTFQNFNNQTHKNDAIHKLTIFHSELEKQKEFEFLVDWAHPFDLIHGKQNLEKNQNGEKYATLKCSIKIAKCSGKEFFKAEEKVSNFQ